jgi:arylsulfatase A-like enzyme
MNKPNIIYIHSHDTGRYIQPYGHAVSTPNLQKLAEGGVLFRQAFCTNPTCSPSRASLLTGQYPHQNGMMGLAHRGFSLNDYGRHIINFLRPYGYHSALAGMQHIASMHEVPWQTIGYDTYLGDTPQAHEGAVKFLDNAPKEPFFLSVGFFETHRTFPTEHPDDDPRYILPPAPLPDTPENREDMARFKQSARIFDRKVGMVMEALERNKLAKNTLVICTTDHGIAFPRMKCNLEDSGTGIMLIIKGPGGFSGGKVVDGMVSHLDIYPTICDLLKIDEPEWLEGKSLSPLVNGEKEEIHEAVFGEVNYHAAEEPLRSVRTKRWKYIRRYDGRKNPVLPNCDAGFSKTTWLEHGWRDRAPFEESLFDLIFDPNEQNNLIGKPEYHDILEEMKKRLENWMEQTSDPLLTGKLPVVEGMFLNGVDELDPDPIRK